MKLYELNDNIRELTQLLEDYADKNGGEVLPSLESMLNALNLEREEKIGNICLVIKELRRELEAIEKEKAYIEQRRKSVDNRIDRLKTYLTYNIPVGETKKGQYYWKESESVEALDISKVPDIYIKKELTNKRELLLDLKNGADIHGVALVKRRNLVIK